MKSQIFRPPGQMSRGLPHSKIEKGRAVPSIGIAGGLSRNVGTNLIYPPFLARPVLNLSKGRGAGGWSKPLLNTLYLNLLTLIEGKG